MSRELAEREIFNLRRQIDVLLRAGCTEEVKRLEVFIAHLQQAHGAVQGKNHEGGAPMAIEELESLTSEDRAIPDVCAEITGTLEGAFAVLLARRDSAYASAIAGLETERVKLTQEAASIEESERNLGELIPAKMRVARAEADQLLVQGKTAEAHRKIAEAQQAEHAPEVISERQRAIRERLEAIEAEKRHAARRVFSEWHREVCAVHRAIEHAHFIFFLDGTKQAFFDFEQSTSTYAQKVGDPGLFTVGHLTGLTADEHSPEWASGTRWYSGRERR